jgi:FAD/FMN-containing dehydrogenase
MAAEARMERSKPKVKGGVVQRGDEGYEEARKVYNGMIDRRPLMVAYCTDAADVAEAVRFGRQNNLRVAVRGGGHNGGGLGICDDGLVIDLSRINGVQVDRQARTVSVGGGCTWGAVDKVTHEFGLAVPTGIIASTGVGGLTLGGGLGYLTRKFGLTIDNLLAADLVLADGSVVTASPDEHADLFWAIRGGGGNFGIVTRFLFRGQPVKIDYAGPTLWPVEKAAEVMKWYREFIVEAPEDLNGFFAFMVVPPGPPFPEHLHGKNMCGVVWCYTGPQDQAERAFEPIRGFGPPAFEFLGPMPHPMLQSMFDPLYPPGLRWYWRADFFKELSDEAIDVHAKFGSEVPTPLSAMHLYPVNGAAHRVGNGDTPWAYRDAHWAQVIVGVDPDPANDRKIIGWTKSYHDAMHAHSAGGAYVNFMMEEGQERVKATYRDNYKRLAAIKKAYDPDNFFRVNQNIQPAP